MFHQIFHPATEILTQAINRFGAGAIALLIEYFGKRHSVQAGRGGDLVDGNAPPFSKLFLFNHLAQFESDHALDCI